MDVNGKIGLSQHDRTLRDPRKLEQFLNHAGQTAHLFSNPSLRGSPHLGGGVVRIEHVRGKANDG